MNKAIDEVRPKAAKVLHDQEREPVLKNSRWVFLKRSSKLTIWQHAKLADRLSLGNYPSLILPTLSCEEAIFFTILEKSPVDDLRRVGVGEDVLTDS